MSIVRGSEIRPTNEAENATELQNGFDKRRNKASALIIVSLEDKPLKVVQKFSKYPQKMWERLEARYAAKKISNKLSILHEIFSKTYTAGDDLSDFIRDLETSFSKLENAGQTLTELLQVSVLLTSLKECEEFQATVAAIRTMEETNATWESVTTRLIDEYKEKFEGQHKVSGASAAYAGRRQKRIVANAAGRKHYYRNKYHETNRQRNNNSYRYNNGTQQYNNIRHPKSYKRQEKEYNPRLAIAKASLTKTTAINGTMKAEFIVDSVATHHMCYNKELFRSLESNNNQVSLGDESVLHSTLMGTIDIKLSSEDTESETYIRLHKVLYVPDLGINLISVSAFDQNEISTSFGYRKCQLLGIRDKRTIGTAFLNDEGLYTIHAKICDPNKFQLHKASVWHQILGHLDPRKISEMEDSPNLLGIYSNDQPDTVKCTPCAVGKQTRGSSKGTLGNHLDSVGDKIFSDICGPIEDKSWGNARYFVSFTDAASNSVWVNLLKKKSDVFEAFQKLVHKLKTQNEITIKKLHTDNGGEYKNIRFQNFYSSHGIIHTFTAPYNTQSNGIAERLNRTLMEKVRTMISQAKRINAFWGEALLQAVNIQNAIPRHTLNGKTPHEAFTGEVPDLSNVKIFGCQVYVTNVSPNKKKVDKRAQAMILLGNVGPNMYRVFNPENNRVTVTRYCKFNENYFPGYPPKMQSSKDVEDDVVSIEISDRDGKKMGIKPEIC